VSEASSAMPRWYVVHTQPNREGRALAHLLMQGFHAYLPRYGKLRRHARRAEWVLAPLFPRYLFVAMDVAGARWRSINGTVGVSHLVCHGDRPTAVPPGIVEGLRAQESEDGAIAVATASLQPGQRLRIAAGAFADCVGCFVQMADRERVILLLELLGRAVRVEVPLVATAAEA